MISLQEWQNLLTYYITCLEKEVAAQSTFSVKAEGYVFETNFLKEENLFSCGQETITIPLTERLNRFTKKAFFSGKANKLFYAYPFVCVEDGSLVPVFITEISFSVDEKNKTITFSKGAILPELNYSLLSKEGLVHEQIYEKIQEVDASQREHNSEIPEKDRFLEILRLSLTETRFEDMFALNTSELDNVDLNTIKNGQIYNQAFIYWGEASSYIKGLVYELNELKKSEYYDQLENTSLKYLFGAKIEKKEKEIPFIFSVLPLNENQKEAIEKGLTESFTVVTGPPGTGKSQVLVNLIINTLVNNKSVLFASKNNKAVDVVYERLDTLTKESYVVRSGNKAFREAAFNTLEEKAERIKFGKNKNKFLEIKSETIKAIKLIEKIEDQIKLRIETKTKTKILNKQAEKIEKKYLWFKDNKNLKLHEKDTYNILIKKFTRLSGGNKTFLETINDYFLKVKTKEKLFQQFNKYLKENGFVFFNISSYADLEKSLNELTNFTQYKKIEKGIYKNKKILRRIPLIKELRVKLEETTKYLYESSLALYENKWLHNLETSSPSQAVALQDFIKVQKELNSNVRLGSRFYRLKERISDLIVKVLDTLPIWGVTNLAVKDTFPLTGGLFDLAVIDESSQCDIPSSIPLLFRAKRLMIIGDEKQLKHISTIPQRKNVNYFEDCKVDLPFDVFSYNDQSLFNISDREYSQNDKKSLILAGHYRCHKEIIDFSNEQFYEGRLELLTDSNKFKVKEPGIYWYDLKGKGQRPGPGNIYNIEEADKVVEMMLDFILDYKNTLTYGVITPFTKQETLIKNKIIKQIKPDSADKIDLTIGTVYKFQGDEKDIIIYSPTVTKGLPEGTINFVNNKNLMNVAITRAKQKLVIVGDFNFALNSTGLLSDLAMYVKGLNHVINK